MVSVNVPTEIRTTTDVQQAIDAHTEALSNSNDTQAAAARRVLVVQRALAPVALHGEIDAAITRMDRNARIKDLVSSEPNRLSGERGQIAAKLNDTAPGQREAGMTQALAQLTEARTKLSELGDNARPDSLTPSRMDLTTLYRDQIKAIQDMATTGKLKTVGTTEVTINPVLTPTEKDKLTKPFSMENGKTDASKLNLGRGYVQAEGAVVEGPAANNEFRLNTAPVNSTFKLVAGKWQVARVAIGADAANAALGYVDPLAAAAKYDVTKAPFDTDAAAKTKAETHNRMVDNLIALNLGSAAVDVAAGPLGDMIGRANTAEATRAGADLTALDTAQSTFFATDFNAGVTRLNGAVTPEAKTRALDNTTAPDLGLRVLVQNRRDALWEKLKTISDAPNRPSNYVEQVTKIQDQLREVGTRLRAEEVRVGVAPPAAPVTPPASVDSLPVAERAPVEAFNNFLRDNAVVNALTDVEATRKPAVDAIVAQLPTLTTDGQRKLGRAAVEAKMTAKGYTVTALEFSPARLEIRRTAEAAPVTPEITTFLGTETERNTLRDALRTNVATPDAAPVRTAITAFQGRLAAVPEGQRAAAVARLNETVRVPATATTDGLEIAINGTNLEARRINRAGTTPPPAAERKERNERMSEFMKILIELIRALLQIEQQRTAVMARGVEAQMKLAAQIEAQMKALPPAGRRDATQEQQFNKMRNDLNRVQGELATFRKQREESIAKANAAIARRPNNTLVVEADADIRRPVRVCVRRGVNLTDPGVSARVSADINFVRADSGLPLVATTSPSAAAPTRVVPTTAFYVGSVHIDNRATTTATITNSPGARIDASSTARTDVAPPAPRVTPLVRRPDAPPPPPRVTGTGTPAPGSLNG